MVEVMVVMSIISLLSSFLMTRVTQARAKAQDTARTQTVIQVSNAIKGYTLDKGAPPTNFNGTSVALSSDAPDGTGQNAFQKSMQQLVDAKYLSKIPETTNGIPYVYYNYGPPLGAVFGTTLSTIAPNTAGQGNSCRFSSAPSPAACSALTTEYFNILSCPAPGHTTCGDFTTQDVIDFSQCPSGMIYLSIFLCHIPSQEMLDDNFLNNINYTTLHSVCTGGGSASVCSSSSANSDFCICSSY